MGTAAAALLVGAGAVLSPASAALAADSASLSPTFNGPVYAVAFGGNNVYVGGAFTSAIVGGRNIARPHLAAFNATTGALLGWNPGADASVRAIAVTGDDVYVAGDFGRVGDLPRDSLARVSASTGAVAGMRHTITGLPRTLGIGNGRLYLGGAVTAVDGQPRGRLAAFSLSTGALDTGWAAGTDDTVEALVVTSGRIYLGGTFRKTNNVSSSGKLTAVHPITGALDMAFLPRPPVLAHAIAVDSSGVVYAALGGQGGRLTAYDPNGTTRWMATFDGDPQAVAVLDGVVYVGGHFDNLCKSNANGTQGVCTDGALVRVKHAAFTTGGAPTPWAPNGNGIVGSVAMVASAAVGAVISAGEFTTIKGSTQRRLAVFKR